MHLWDCEFQGCRRPALQGLGNCLLCDRHLCRHHLKAEWHKCPDPDLDWNTYSTQYANAEARRLASLAGQINVPKLLERASLLRGGIQCRTVLSPKALSAMMGGQNCHAIITFNDGVEWIVRFRLEQVISPPPGMRDYILRSEAASLLFLQTHCSGIPSPKIYDWACQSDPGNEIGVGYIMMQKMEGRPLQWNGATHDQREKVLGQLVDIYLELEKHPFSSLGSLLPEASQQDGQSLQLGAFATPTYFSSKTGKSLGPFQKPQQELVAVNEAIGSMIATGEFGTMDPVDDYLMHLCRAELSKKFWINPQNSTTQSHEKFYLKHPDDKGDHILVNHEFDIVGVIDWEWARTVSKEDAFSSPCMMWPVSAFYDGSNELAEDEVKFARMYEDRGRPDLARCVREGRKIQRLAFATDNLNGGERDAIGLFGGLRSAFDPGDDLDWEAWKKAALERYKDDQVLQGLLAK
ncbi:hypothetical protein PG990_013191 [Apiospora arundinis]